jgi:hypothetical protein
MAKAKSTMRPRRASQRTVLSIDLSQRSLRDLMIEQCKGEAHNYITVYHGSRAELVASGVPESLFPTGQTEAEFQFQNTGRGGGGRQMLSGSLRPIATGFELEVDWASDPPHHCSHPAIVELARMLLKDMCHWTDGYIEYPGTPDLAYPIDEVVADERAVDYKPRPGAPRLQVSKEFHRKLHDYARYLFDWVYTDGEVFPCADAAAKRRPQLRLVSGEESAHG